ATEHRPAAEGAPRRRIHDSPYTIAPARWASCSSGSCRQCLVAVWRPALPSATRFSPTPPSLAVSACVPPPQGYTRAVARLSRCSGRVPLSLWLGGVSWLGDPPTAAYDAMPVVPDK